MPITATLSEGDILQFPSHSLKKILKIADEWITFGAIKKPKKQASYSCDRNKQSVYSMGFVLAHCDLVPENVDLQYYLNTMHTRRSAVAPSIDAYSDANTLKGYIIDDEEILDMPIMEDDE